MTTPLIKKRNGELEPINILKIIDVLQAADKGSKEKTDPQLIRDIAVEAIAGNPKDTTVLKEKIEESLVKNNCVELATSYIIGCYEKEVLRRQGSLDKSILGLIGGGNYTTRTENANKDANDAPTQRDLIAGEVSKDLAKRFIFPKEVVAAHDAGAIHIHDMDYAIQPLTNCHLVNLKDMFTENTVMNHVLIEAPQSLRTATTVATQIALAISSSQYGGQTMSLAHLAPFVDASRQKIKQEMENLGVALSEDQLEKMVGKEVRDSIQTLNYQLNSTKSASGQSPFITIFMYLGEAENEREKEDMVILIKEILRQRIIGFKNERGQYVTPTFPKLVLVLEEDIVNEDGKYHELFGLAAQSISKRMAPDLMSEKKAKEVKRTGVWANLPLEDVPVVPPMGCRSFLQPYNDENGKPKIYGRFNLGVVSMNIPYIAYKSGGDLDLFWKDMDEYADLIFKAHMARVRHLKGAKASVAPILWRHGAIARLDEDEPIEKLFYDDYASISLGFMGIYEAVKHLTGLSHSDPRAEEMAELILDRLNGYCAEWKRRTGLGFSLYGTPGESLTGKFAGAIKRDFDPSFSGHVTNSYHVPVDEKIDAFTKLNIEAPLQFKTTAGAISYVEVGDLTKNPGAIEALMRHIYENVWYGEINTRSSDVCGACGFEGEIELKKIDGEFVWVCPQCGETSVNGDGKPSKLSVVRRLCGYCGDIGQNGANDGRLDDIGNRVLHLE